MRILTPFLETCLYNPFDTSTFTLQLGRLGQHSPPKCRYPVTGLNVTTIENTRFWYIHIMYFRYFKHNLIWYVHAVISVARFLTIPLQFRVSANLHAIFGALLSYFVLQFKTSIMFVIWTTFILTFSSSFVFSYNSPEFSLKIIVNKLFLGTDI
jgi:hypothetical protein